tara:strand:- start:1009 stop:1152 length:144 start_codon:yes stop_codon:yes gene_type:complete
MKKLFKLWLFLVTVKNLVLKISFSGMYNILFENYILFHHLYLKEIVL